MCILRVLKVHYLFSKVIKKMVSYLFNLIVFSGEHFNVLTFADLTIFSKVF